jgi:hypothetical protein
MQPPSNFIDTVRAGARLLQSLGTRLRVQAEQTPELPELWLSVRDLEGLAGRLMDSDERDWRVGCAIFVTGQDFAVLDKLLDGSASLQRSLTHTEQNVLRALRGFIQQASNRELDFDEPGA